MIKEYGVVEGNILSDVVNNINKWIDEGWSPLGGLSVYHEHTDFEDIQGKTVFFQSMVKFIQNGTPFYYLI